MSPNALVSPAMETISGNKFQRNYLIFVVGIIWVICGAVTCQFIYSTQQGSVFYDCTNPIYEQHCPQAERQNTCYSPYASSAPYASVINEFKLTPDACLQTGYFGSHTARIRSRFFVGSLLGVVFFGRLGDLKGRRVGLLSAMSLLEMSLILMPMSNSYTMFLICSTVAGAGVGASGILSIIVITEISKKEKRHLISIVQSGTFTIGVILSSLAYWIVPLWRFLLGFNAAMGLLLFVSISRVEFIESPKWFLGQNKLAEALSVQALIHSKTQPQMGDSAHKNDSSAHNNDQSAYNDDVLLNGINATIDEEIQMSRCAVYKRVGIFLALWFTTSYSYYVCFWSGSFNVVRPDIKSLSTDPNHQSEITHDHFFEEENLRNSNQIKTDENKRTLSETKSMGKKDPNQKKTILPARKKATNSKNIITSIMDILTSNASDKIAQEETSPTLSKARKQNLKLELKALNHRLLQTLVDPTTNLMTMLATSSEEIEDSVALNSTLTTRNENQQPAENQEESLTSLSELVFWTILQASCDTLGVFLFFYLTGGSLYPKLFIVCSLMISATINFMLTGGLFFAAANFYLQHSIKALVLLQRTFLSLTFTLIYVFTTVSMPVTLRASALGLSSMAARVGAIYAPFIVQLYASEIYKCFLILGLLQLFAAILTKCIHAPDPIQYQIVAAETNSTEPCQKSLESVT